MLAMLPTVIVVAVTPVAVAPPLPPDGAWLPLAPHAPAPAAPGAAAEAWLAAAPPVLAAPVCAAVEPMPPPVGPLARPGVLDDEHGAVVVVVVLDDEDGLAVVVVVDLAPVDLAAVVVGVVVDEVDEVDAQPVELAPRA